MKATELADIQDWLDEQSGFADWLHTLTPEQRRQEDDLAEWCERNQYDPYARNGETAQQHLDALVDLRRLGHCPRCGQRYVELTKWSFPDMVGDTYGWTFECCGYDWSESSALEYAPLFDADGNETDGFPTRHRRHVDIR